MADASAAYMHSGLYTFMTGYADAFLNADTYWRFLDVQKLSECNVTA
jgi:hypothetical protein